MGNTQINYAKARRTPSAVFSNPEAVAEHTDLTDTQKIEVLCRWEFDVKEMERAGEKDTSGGERPLLPRIKKAIEVLRAKEAS